MKNDVILLDGGMGQELYRRGLKGDQELWSANALLSDAHIVQDIHTEFIDAGAQVITTNSYCTHPGRLSRAGMGEHLKSLNDIAGYVAREACNKSSRKGVLVAASIPPQYSFRPDIVFGEAQMFDEYAQMVELLNPYVDLFLCETMTNAAEAYTATSACAVTGKPVWCAWTFKDDASGLLRSDEDIVSAVERLKGIKIDAFLANCCTPESVTKVIEILHDLFDGDDTRRHIGGYANGFTPIPPQWDPGDIETLGVRPHLTPQAYTEFAMEWVAQGASIVGGCCEISPAHIRAIYEALNAL